MPPRPRTRLSSVEAVAGYQASPRTGWVPPATLSSPGSTGWPHAAHTVRGWNFAPQLCLNSTGSVPGAHCRSWETTRLEAPGNPAIEITATPCRHGAPLSRPLAGHVVGFALRWDGQEHGVLWISGDTVLYGGVRQVANWIEVDTAVLHLGGVRFPVTGPLRYSMTRDRQLSCAA